MIQRREKPDVAFFVGTGKLEKIRLLIEELGVGVVVFDGELSPPQQRNIEESVGVKVIDRTQVILEIFSKHATTAEGKLQVELAKLVYELPRLRGKGEFLSNLGGGIGTRGPGETALESSKRKIKARIAELRRKIGEIRKNREISRKSRLEALYPIVSIVGYTNAGKSTLLRYLSRDRGILVSDQLFSTLNPTTKRVRLPNGRVALFSDTVGFVRNLPHTLVEAFKSTLEEVCYSDVLVLLADASDVELHVKLATTEEVLREIGAHQKPKVLAFNKVDKIPMDYFEELRCEYPDAVFLSALTGYGVHELLRRIQKLVSLEDECFELTLSQDELNVLLRYRELIEFRRVDSSVDGHGVYRVCGPRGILEKIRSTTLQTVGGGEAR